MIFFVFFTILSAITGQLGPNYDPLLYDVVISSTIGIIFLIIIIVVIVLVIRKIRKNKQFQESFDDSSTDSSDGKKWDGI